MEQLVQKVPLVWRRRIVGAAWPRIPKEEAIDPVVLSAWVRRQVLPLRIFRVFRRIYRAGADMAKGAGHADPVRANQIAIVVIGRVVVVTSRIPPCLCAW